MGTVIFCRCSLYDHMGTLFPFDLVGTAYSVKLRLPGGTKYVYALMHKLTASYPKITCAFRPFFLLVWLLDGKEIMKK